MCLGYVDWDSSSAANERIRFRALLDRRDELVRNKIVRVKGAAGDDHEFLGKIVGGPFFPPVVEKPTRTATVALGAVGEIEIRGELLNGRLQSALRRPAPGAQVCAMTDEEISELLRCEGDMTIGALADNDDVALCLQSKNKGVLPRNIGIFGTVGSGKSNTTQVLIEEAARSGWAVIVLDVEGEYTFMDSPSDETSLFDRLKHFRMAPEGIKDFQVYYPVSCECDRPDAEAFTLRLSDFEADIVGEILETSNPERNALRDCIEHLQQKAKTSVKTNETKDMLGILDASPDAPVPYKLYTLIERARERGPRSAENLDYIGLVSKLTRLHSAEVVDQLKIKAIDAQRLVHPGRVSVFDVSVANDMVKSLVNADLLRKVFSFKIINENSPPTMIVIEEAHTFISKQAAKTMQATLQMLRTVARRGRKRWLSLTFVSQQPGHLPPEIFELCNTRIVHSVRSLHNLDALMTTASEVGKDTWMRCPLLRPGEAVVSSPQLDGPCEIKVRPARSRRKFTR